MMWVDLIKDMANSWSYIEYSALADSRNMQIMSISEFYQKRGLLEGAFMYKGSRDSKSYLDFLGEFMNRKTPEKKGEKPCGSCGGGSVI